MAMFLIFAGISFCEWRFVFTFAGIYFRELAEIRESFFPQKFLPLIRYITKIDV